MPLGGILAALRDMKKYGLRRVPTIGSPADQVIEGDPERPSRGTGSCQSVLTRGFKGLKNHPGGTGQVKLVGGHLGGCLGP